MPRAWCSAGWPPKRRACSRASTSRSTPRTSTRATTSSCVNAAKVKLTGRKEEQKLYRYHSGYEGGLREERAKDVRQKNPVRIVEEAVRGMLPKTKMGEAMWRKLKVYAGARTPARGAEARQAVKTTNARGRITWQQAFSITAPGAARHPPPACFSGPAPAASIVNRKPIEQAFPTEALRTQIKQPLAVTETADKFDVLATIAGGGIAGQAGALRLGIARALVEYNIELRQRLKKAGFLTRDARIKERKKYGQKGARKRFQFSKR